MSDPYVTAMEAFYKATSHLPWTDPDEVRDAILTPDPGLGTTLREHMDLVKAELEKTS